MNKSNYSFTSESVSEGHPDKVCDQISDAILDAYIAQDPESRVACETLVKNNIVVLAGEITSNATKIDATNIARATIREIGYDNASLGFDCDTCEVIPFITSQSEDISVGVTKGTGKFKEQGAGDQGLMFGFACTETPELMPLPISLSHKLVQHLASVRKAEKVSYLRPDSKSQVTVRYAEGVPVAVDAVVISTQHSPDVTHAELESFVIDEVIKKVIPANLLHSGTNYLINPTGKFVIGGPVGDAGLTGRKIIVDSYGGYSRHGGGAFSGKDPSKVDRSAAYVCRYVAKNVVSAGIASKCEVQIAYAIGVAEPVSVFVDTFGTSQVDEKRIENTIREVFDLTPQGIIDSLKLKNPIYLRTASYGHFGRTPDPQGGFTWEKLDKTDELRGALA